MASVQRVFKVNGKPFFPLGGQVFNSSAYTAEEMETAWRALKAIHANTVEAPVYWEQVEPDEGRFDFAPVDALLEGAREHGLKLIILWFATWKNGCMKYAPAWVKRDPERFRRVQTPAGAPLAVLSPHCQANWEADRRAFCALLEHLRRVDGEQRTVIAIQVENEPGSIGSDRDYGPDGQAAYQAPVPSELVAALRRAQGGPVHAAWQANGARQEGSWPELFGWQAGEYLSAWQIAHYIDGLAAAGKAIYGVPMYVNVWLGEGSWRIPGLTYPAGGAVAGVLDIWKWSTPHIDLIAPDIYRSDWPGYLESCAAYARLDNPLFVPESAPAGHNAHHVFRAVADYDAIGYACFGVESVLADDGSVRPEARTLVESFRCLAAALPLLLRYQGTGRIRAIDQQEGMGEQYLDLGDYIGRAVFFSADSSGARTDFHHRDIDRHERGRGLVIQAGPNEFYLVGAGFRLLLLKKQQPEAFLGLPWANEFHAQRLSNYVQVAEGHFADGTWISDRRRNGDESDFGVWVTPDVGVVHVVAGD